MILGENFPIILKLQNASRTFAEAGEKIYVKKNQVIISPGEIINGFYYIQKGRVLCVDYSPRGNEKIEFILETGSIFLESNVLFDRPASVYFKAITDTQLVYITREKLLDMITNDLNVSLFIMESLTKKFYSSVAQLREVLFYDVECRVCNLFLTMAEKFGIEEENAIKLDIKISQQFISNILGINRNTCIRMINKLKKLNYINQIHGYYYIVDFEGLKQYHAQKIVQP
ncbi:cyclic nucleotide-binding protein [Dehalobacter sp. MCB1]|nr:cyclic nucleotide-binding protein [Dehalobacter sp. MCB1]